MLSSNGFDFWADGYDRTVGLSDEDGSYPFAGYRAALGRIYSEILSNRCHDILDVGFGTGTLACRLYEQGCAVSGQDFSSRMIELARVKMPNALLVQGDFSDGLAPCLCAQRYDAIVATYSLHHLTDARKVSFIEELLHLLRPSGRLLIGDVAFENRAALERCRTVSGDEWDDEEIYFVADELAPLLSCKIEFESISHCAGILRILKN